MKSSTVFRNALLGSTGFAECFPAGVLIDIMSGTVPTDPEDAVTGTKLGTISLSGSGAALVFDPVANGAVAKPAAASWLCSSLLSGGVVTYLRLYKFGDAPNTADSAKYRMDITVGVAGSGADVILPSTTLNALDPFQLNSFAYSLA